MCRVHHHENIHVIYGVDSSWERNSWKLFERFRKNVFKLRDPVQFNDKLHLSEDNENNPATTDKFKPFKINLHLINKFQIISQKPHERRQNRVHILIKMVPFSY